MVGVVGAVPSEEVIHACARSNGVRIVSSESECRRGEEYVAWNAKGEKGDPGASWLVGSGSPDSTLGNVDDLYLDDDTGDVYQKLAGGWTFVANLRGPQGPAGSDGGLGPAFDYLVPWFQEIGTEDTVLASLEVPEGNYLVSSKFEVGFGPGVGGVACELRDPVGTSNDQATTHTNNGRTIVLHMVTSRPEPGPLELVCSRAGVESAQVLRPSFTAVEVGAVQHQDENGPFF